MSLTTPVAYWRTEEASGTRADSSGNGRDLTANGSPGNRVGKLGNAADFVPGSSQYLSTTDATVRGTIVDTASWTLAGWLYSDDDATRDICGHLAVGGAGGLRLSFQSVFNVSRELVAIWFDDTATAHYSYTSTSFTSGAWNFFAVKYDAGDNKLYTRANGMTAVGYTMGAAAFTTYGSYFSIGRAGPVAPTYWDGGIDNVGLWAEALSSADLDTLYAAGAGYDPTLSGQPMAMRGVQVPHLAGRLWAPRYAGR